MAPVTIQIEELDFFQVSTGLTISEEFDYHIQESDFFNTKGLELNTMAYGYKTGELKPSFQNHRKWVHIVKKGDPICTIFPKESSVVYYQTPDYVELI